MAVGQIGGTHTDGRRENEEKSDDADSYAITVLWEILNIILDYIFN